MSKIRNAQTDVRIPVDLNLQYDVSFNHHELKILFIIWPFIILSPSKWACMITMSNCIVVTVIVMTL